jgi:hypothetical protein
MPSRRAELSGRAVRWLVPTALLALTPKCLLCVLAYAGIGAALGLRSPEICGAAVGPAAPWALLLAGFGFALAVAGLVTGLRYRRNSSRGRRSYS